MPNSQLYPFERNRYYPGKMLTTADFQAEQNYHINKMRFMNSLMYGAGIVCGCGVFNLDDLSILVESGVVIDYTGREIIIDSSVVKKLSTIEGFDQINSEIVSLCVRFKETDIHSVYAVGHNDGDQDYEFNRISEGFELFLVNKDEYDEGIELNSEFLAREQIFRGADFEGALVMPTIACKGRNVRIRLEIRKTSDAEARLSYKGILDIPGFTAPDGSQQIEIGVDDLELGEGEVIYKDYWMNVQNMPGLESNVILRSGSGAAFVNDAAIASESSVTMRVRLSDEAPASLVSRELGRLNLEMRQGMGDDSIKLCDIRLMRTDSAYVIEEILDLKKNEYIDLPAQNAIRSEYMEYYVRKRRSLPPLRSPLPRQQVFPKPPYQPPNLRMWLPVFWRSLWARMQRPEI